MHSLVAEFPELTIEQSDLHLSSCVGKGAFADVYKATWRGDVVAVKQLRHKGSYAVNILQRLANEIRIMLYARLCLHATHLWVMHVESSNTPAF